jgi:hypothetical protein
VRTIPDFYLQYLSSWWNFYLLWNGIYYSLGVLGTVLPIVVATKPTFLAAENNNLVWSGFSFAAAVCTGLMTFLNPSVQAKNNHDAWLTLNQATRAYIEDQTTKPEVLRDAYNRGEQILANIPLPASTAPTEGNQIPSPH